jgi:hypothetical protein
MTFTNSSNEQKARITIFSVIFSDKMHEEDPLLLISVTSFGADRLTLVQEREECRRVPYASLIQFIMESVTLLYVML